MKKFAKVREGVGRGTASHPSGKNAYFAHI
jgi:hypothetical protein